MTNDEYQEARLALAEWQGWKRLVDDPSHLYYNYFAPPDGDRRWSIIHATSDPPGFHVDGLPDPKHKDTDAMALRAWLIEQGYIVKVRWSKRTAFVEIHKEGTTNWRFGEYYDAVEKPDYREGVVTLAMEVLKNG